MYLIKYCKKIIIISAIYYASIITLFYLTIKLNMVHSNISNTLHSANYAPSISFIIVIFLPLLIIPNIILSFEKYYSNKNTLFITYLMNVIFISCIPIFILILAKAPPNSPIFMNIIISQITSIIINTFFYKIYKKN
jgi:hypothetical protein